MLPAPCGSARTTACRQILTGTETPTELLGSGSVKGSLTQGPRQMWEGSCPSVTMAPAAEFTFHSDPSKPGVMEPKSGGTWRCQFTIQAVAPEKHAKQDHHPEFLIPALSWGLLSTG